MEDRFLRGGGVFPSCPPPLEPSRRERHVGLSFGHVGVRRG